MVATALGLKEITDAEREAKAKSDLPAALRANIGKRIEISLKNLEKIIADPSVRLTVHDIKGLHDRTDLWVGRTDAMVDTLVRAFDAGGITRERAGMLQDLLNKLPASEYRPVAEKILSALTARPELNRDLIRSSTLDRLGELGPMALPLLEDRLLVHKHRLNSGAVLGLCKIGAAASRLAETIANTALDPKSKHEGDVHFNAYVTLLRLGRPDLAENVRDGTRLAKNRTATSVSLLIDPASPADVCVNRNEWRTRLRKA